MGLFKGKNYRTCQPGEDSSIVECQSYKPSREGKKDVVAVIKIQKLPDCRANILFEDGSPEDINDLKEYLNKSVGVKCIPKHS